MDISKEIEVLLTSEVFKALRTADVIQLQQLFAVQSLLIKLGLPFNITFSPSTKREAAAAELTVFLSPTVTIRFVFSFEAGGSIFGSFSI